MRKFLDSLLKLEEKYLTTPIILGLSVFIGLTLTILYVCLLDDLYRDVSACYAPFARLFAEGRYLDGMNPALPIMQIVLAGTLSMISGLEAVRSVLLVSGFFYLLTIIPLYFLLKRFISPRLAAWGTVVYILAPKIIRFSLTGVPEPARNFFLIAAVLAVFLLIDRQTVKRALLLGAALAGFTLSRSEGIVISFMMLGATALYLLILNRPALGLPKALQKAFLYSLLVFACFFTLLVPRLYTNWKLTGYPTPDSRLNVYAHRYLTPSIPLRNLSGPKVRHTELSLQREAENDKSLVNRFFQQFEKIQRGAYEVYIAFAIIGLLSGFFVTFIRRKLLPEWQPIAPWASHRMEYSFFMLLILMHILVYVPVPTAYRYYTFCSLLLIPLVMAGLYFFWELFRRFRLEQIMVLAMIVLAVAHIDNSADVLYNQAPHRQAGEWVQKNFTPANRPLVVLNYHAALLYWTGGEMLNPHYEGPETLPEFADGFDVAVVAPHDAGRLAVLRSRTDLEEVPTPYEKFMVVFKRIGQ